MRGIISAIIAFAGCLASVAFVPQAPQGDSPRERSLQRLVARADSGVPQALFALSGLVERGEEGFARDSVMALALLRRSAETGYAPACNYLGYCYFVPSLGLKQNADSALLWIERAATAPRPDPKAFSNLGMLLLTGEGGVRRDYAKAAYWLERAAAQGVPAAAGSLGRLYLQGLGVERDTVRAISLLTDAARAGHIDAGKELYDLTRAHTDTLCADSLTALALDYLRMPVYEMAIPLLKRAALLGDARAKAAIAQCYAMGTGVPYDYGHALALFLEAAQAGDPSAQYIIGEALATQPDLPGAEGTIPDDWFARAAAGGVRDARQAIARLR